MECQKSAEGIVGPPTGLKARTCSNGMGAGISMMNGGAERRAGTAHATSESRGRISRGYGVGASNITARTEHCHPESDSLMEAMVGRENMWDAYARVLSNKGAAGVDGISVHELGGECKRKWVSIREELLEGRYVPQPVLGVEIPKPGGGVRQLGIPTVMDRLIQAGIASGTDADIRSGLLGIELRLPPGTKCSSGRVAGQAVRRVRKAVGRGHGSGEVLRPREPRRADGTDCAEGDGQAGTAVDPQISRGRIDDGRYHDPAENGNAARRPALTALVQYPAG